MAKERKAVEEERILRQPEVSEITGLPKTSMYRLIRENNFPDPVVISRQSVGWLASEVQEWIKSRKRTKPPRDPEES